MRISFDLDEVLFVNPENYEIEPPPGWLHRRIYRERLPQKVPPITRSPYISMTRRTLSETRGPSAIMYCASTSRTTNGRPKYLMALAILMLINDVIQVALAYRDYKKRMNRLAFKRLARMRKKAIQRAQSRTQS